MQACEDVESPCHLVGDNKIEVNVLATARADEVYAIHKKLREAPQDAYNEADWDSSVENHNTSEEHKALCRTLGNFEWESEVSDLVRHLLVREFVEKLSNQPWQENSLKEANEQQGECNNTKLDE